MKIIYSNILFLCLVVAGCAVVSSPDGGPTDETPPELVSSDPADQELNFSGTTLTLTFNEYVELNNPNEQILVTPRLEEDLEVYIKRKSVVIEFQEQLMENTTYTLTFREAIRDITERNPASNLRLAFSTGNYIDTARISGTVIDHMSQLPIENAIVGLYFADDTLDIINSEPSYMTYTREDGSFLMTNLKQGRYKLYALLDRNRNSMLDFKNEAHGFLPDILQLDTAINDLRVSLIRNDLRTMQMTSHRVSGRYFQARYSKGVSAFSTNREDQVLGSIQADDPEVIRFYNTFEEDSLFTVLTAVDSIGQATTDSIWIKFSESPRDPVPYRVEIISRDILRSSDSLTGTIRFNKPSTLYHTDSVYIEADTLATIPLSMGTFNWSGSNHKLDFTIPLDTLIPDTVLLRSYRLVLGDSTFRSVENQYSRSSTARINTFVKEDRAIIETRIPTAEKGFLLQLINMKYELQREISNVEKHDFQYLAPGSYMLRVLIDENGNGIWDPGNIINGELPEPVWYYVNSEGQREIPVRANFIIGPLIIDFL